MKFAIVVFPGSNCDHDAYHAATAVIGQEAQLIWHKETSLGGADAVILPGGFAHGDYLRTGAIARFSPIMPGMLGAVAPSQRSYCTSCYTGTYPVEFPRDSHSYLQLALKLDHAG